MLVFYNKNHISCYSLNNISLHKDLKEVIAIKNTKKVFSIGKCKELSFLVSQAGEESKNEESLSFKVPLTILH